ncbi:MAG: hypothetical protein GXO94_08195 [Nitrospirae bacterium]|nr:hypothetical protein [Nitrospirota bacterium]
MKRMACRPGFAVVLLLMMVFPASASTGAGGNAVLEKASGLRMPFIENRGQVGNESVRFYACTFAGTVYVTESGGIVYSLAGRPNGPASLKAAVVLRESLVGPKGKDGKEAPVFLHPVGTDRAVARVNYFVGRKENWRTAIPTWREVSLGEAYKGIELKLRAYGNNVEKLFTVFPGGSVRDIRLRIEGAEGLGLNSEGELEIATAIGTVKMTRPVAYQEIDGKRVEVAAGYVATVQGSGLTYGFRVGDYDKTRPLIIDPLLASTFLGGGSEDNALSVAVDGSGNVYVSGGTRSSDFPTTTGALDSTFSYVEAFVSKFDPDLEELLVSTFIGPAFYSSSMALDGKGNIYLAGVTPSPDFPTTPGAYDRTIGFGDPDPTAPDHPFHDGFISKLDGDLDNLLASTFAGLVTDYDFYGRIEIALDNDGGIYMLSPFRCGYPYSEIYCAFIARFDAGLGNQLASILFPPDTSVSAVSVDGSGNVYVVGTGSSISTTPGAYDETYNGGGDAFVSRLDGNLETTLAATFLGGESGEYPSAVFTDDDGDVYVTGRTTSPDFPTTPGAYDETYNGGGDVFVSKLDGDLRVLLASTFLGGDDSDGADSMVIGGNGNVYVAGRTSSADFPTTPDAHDATLNGSYDAFIARFDGDLKTLLWSTYLGGADRDDANSLTVDSDGNLYVAGRTSSPDFPVTPGSFDTDYDWVDGFVSKFTFGEEGTCRHRHECRH